MVGFGGGGGGGSAWVSVQLINCVEWNVENVEKGISHLIELMKQ